MLRDLNAESKVESFKKSTDAASTHSRNVIGKPLTQGATSSQIN